MGELEKVLNAPHLKEIFIVVVAALLVMKLLISIWDFFRDRFEIETKTSRREKAQSETITNLKNEVDCIKRDQGEIKQTLNGLSEAVSEMQRKSDAKERATLKDRIGQSYRYYKDKGQWNSMEKEAFNDLIESYEAAGGKNSFVHDVCVPKSLEWEVID